MSTTNTMAYHKQKKRKKKENNVWVRKEEKREKLRIYTKTKF